MGATSEDEGSTGDALDIVLYLFVLGPAVEWCLKSPRVNRGRPGSWRGVSLAVLLLALVAAGKMAWESGTREPNHFETLGVRVDAGTAEIKRAYRARARELHPDTRSVASAENGTEDGAEGSADRFSALVGAYQHLARLDSTGRGLVPGSAETHPLWDRLPDFYHHW